jgi:hypothetical protein
MKYKVFKIGLLNSFKISKDLDNGAAENKYYLLKIISHYLNLNLIIKEANNS